MWKTLATGLLDLLLPPVCASCGLDTDGTALCARCDLHPSTLLPDAPPPARLASWTSAVSYEDTARDWVQRFKYPKPGLAGLDPAASAVARDWIRRATGRVPALTPDAVLPIPLHPRRLRERGFNPSALLAGHVARALGTRVELHRLRRVRDTPTQTNLSRGARWRNVQDAFEAHADANTSEVWLVDDVVTTGATLCAAARALRKKGVRRVHALTLAWRPWLG